MKRPFINFIYIYIIIRLLYYISYIIFCYIHHKRPALRRVSYWPAFWPKRFEKKITLNLYKRCNWVSQIVLYYYISVLKKYLHGLSDSFFFFQFLFFFQFFFKFKNIENLRFLAQKSDSWRNLGPGKKKTSSKNSPWRRFFGPKDFFWKYFFSVREQN